MSKSAPQPSLRATFHEVGICGLVRHLFRCRHRDWTGLMDYWDTTATNGFYIPIEQRCSNCGAIRHRRLDARKLGKMTPRWQDGKHPKSPAENSLPNLLLTSTSAEYDAD
jgi:hypothetical protein